jgi:hypothetical protein
VPNTKYHRARALFETFVMEAYSVWDRYNRIWSMDDLKLRIKAFFSLYARICPPSMGARSVLIIARSAILCWAKDLPAHHQRVKATQSRHPTSMAPITRSPCTAPSSYISKSALWRSELVSRSGSARSNCEQTCKHVSCVSWERRQA